MVTAFLQHSGKILLVRRSDKVGSYRGCWSAISGYLEDSTTLAQARREIREETGLSEEDVRLVSGGLPLEIEAPELGCCWVVHPFLFDVLDTQRLQLDWENTELCWIEPAELADYQTVPRLREAYDAVSKSSR